MTVYNLYNYHVLQITFKLLKLRIPTSLFSCFSLSSRKGTLLLYPKFSENFVFSASSLWNKFRDCPEASEISDFNVGIGLVKSKIKALICRRQQIGDSDEWHPEENFSLAQNVQKNESCLQAIIFTLSFADIQAVTVWFAWACAAEGKVRRYQVI